MGFLDDLSRTITDASQGALQKGRDMADTAKYNSLVAEEERQLANLYQQIGRMYFEEHADSATGAYASLVDSVKVSNSKIADYRQRIKLLKGNPRCTNCGAEIPPGTSFCTVCGMRVDSQMGMQTGAMEIKCSECGATVPAGNRYCACCGQPVDEPVNNGMY